MEPLLCGESYAEKGETTSRRRRHVSLPCLGMLGSGPCSSGGSGQGDRAVLALRSFPTWRREGLELSRAFRRRKRTQIMDRDSAETAKGTRGSPQLSATRAERGNWKSGGKLNGIIQGWGLWNQLIDREGKAGLGQRTEEAELRPTF